MTAGPTGHADVFQLEVVLDAVAGAFATQAGWLDPAKGCDLGGDQAGVYADHAGLHRLGHAPDASHVARVEIASQTKLGRIGQPQRLVLRLETDDGRDGAEGLLLADQPVGRDARQHGWLEEGPAQGGALAARHHRGGGRGLRSGRGR